MKPEDVYALTSVGQPRLSPDGRRVAYVVSRIDSEANAYRTAIWIAPLDGSAEPRQFTSGERNDSSPRWSPDGRWLAFVSNRDGEDEKKAKGQLYVMAADGGEPRKLTDGKESVESIAWSPDSERIAFARPVPHDCGSRSASGRSSLRSRASPACAPGSTFRRTSSPERWSASGSGSWFRTRTA